MSREVSRIVPYGLKEIDIYKVDEKVYKEIDWLLKKNNQEKGLLGLKEMFNVTTPFGLRELLLHLKTNPILIFGPNIVKYHISPFKTVLGDMTFINTIENVLTL